MMDHRAGGQPQRVNRIQPLRRTDRQTQPSAATLRLIRCKAEQLIVPNDDFLSSTSARLAE